MMMPTRMVSSEAVLKAVLANEVSSRGGEGGGGEGGGEAAAGALVIVRTVAV